MTNDRGTVHAACNPQLAQLLLLVQQRGGSDLHLSAGLPPTMRLDGQLVPLGGPPLDAEETACLCRGALSAEQARVFATTNELDFALTTADGLRCRGNLFVERGCVGGVFRLVASVIRSAEELGLPPAVERLADLPAGLVLVTGATGSGKSTTLAALTDKINRQRPAHIITIEDPIEFLHTSSLGIVRQREVERDTTSFAAALRHVLRQDPDVVLIGEIRDEETAGAALLIADTGHLVLSTLHSNAAVETIHRVLSLFPADRQPQARQQLAAVLQGVVCQQLLPRRDGHGRAAAYEVLIANTAVRNLIREDKLHQIYSQLQVGQSAFGMHTMAQSLAGLCKRGMISEADALSHSANPDEVRSLLVRAPTSTERSGAAVATAAAR
jgi:twitching motility protein PilT